MAPRGKRGSRRGAAVLVWTVVLFFLGQTLGGLLLDTSWTRVRNPFLHWHLDRLAVLDSPPTIVCLGSSRFGSQLDESEVTRTVRELTGDPKVRVFNASLPAGDPIASERTLDMLLQEGIRPRLLLLEVCPETVGHRNEWLSIHLIRQLDWSDAPSYSWELIRTGHILRYLKARLLPLYQHRHHILEELEKEIADIGSAEDSEPSPIPKGNSRRKRLDTRPASAVWAELVQQTIHDPDADLRKRSEIGLRDVRRFLRGYRTGGNSASALERILARCRAEGIEVVLIGVPVSEPHRAQYTPAIEAAYRAHLQGLCTRFGCRYVDYRAKVPDGLFMDNHHASPEGSVWISRLLAVDLVAPVWEGREPRGLDTASVASGKDRSN